MVKLTRKIQKAAGTVGVEATILGEKATPKNFNAFDRIKKEDSSLLDDMERSAELLSSVNPIQEILLYLKKIGEKEINLIPYGKRSGKNSEHPGLILCYKEKMNKKSLHFLCYDFKQKRFEHINDVSWIFRKLKSNEDTQLKMPFEGIEVFRLISIIDKKAREEIGKSVNAPYETRRTQKIKSKYQRQLYDILFDSYKSGKASHDEINQVFKLLVKGNYVAFEPEFKEIYESFLRNQDVHYIVISLTRLFSKFKLEKRESDKIKEIKSEDLTMVGCMFLMNSSFTDWNIISQIK